MDKEQYKFSSKKSQDINEHIYTQLLTRYLLFGFKERASFLSTIQNPNGAYKISENHSNKVKVEEVKSHNCTKKW